MNSIAHPCFDPIEYIQDRLYLAAYDRPPTARPSLRTPLKKSRQQAAQQQQQQAPQTTPVYFTVDDTLLYNAFHADFGPFHIAHLYRFAVQFHEILADPANNNRIVVFYSKPDARSRANAACLVACYMVLIQSWPPHLALAPIAQADPPYMPFRDAGYSQADFVLGIQDVVYGVWKAKEEGLCGLRDFDLEEYELYERVDMGDFNWITPNFIAFASPQLPSQSVTPIPRDSPAYAALPSTISAVVASSLPLPLKNVLVHFKERDVGLVVRLNSELYCPTYFSALGITHLDMIFEDGTCPPLPLVKKFIELAHETITVHHKSIAVHCKAGLGRTGCLIGAYLIYRHGFTAHEVISFMRFMRPGMVVGPQQHWLHLNQGTFREWWVEEVVREKVLAQVAAANAQAAATAAAAPVTPARGMKQRLVILTPSAEEKASRNGNGNGNAATARSRAALNEIDNEAAAPSTISAATAADSASPHKHYTEDYLPAPTPGQPRKTHRRDSRNHPYARAVSGSLAPRSEELTASGRRRKVSSSLAYLASQSPSPSVGSGSPRDRVSPSPSPTIAEEIVPARARDSGRESPSPSPGPGAGVGAGNAGRSSREGATYRRVVADQARQEKRGSGGSGRESDEEVKMRILAAVKGRRVRGGSPLQQSTSSSQGERSAGASARGTGATTTTSGAGRSTAPITSATTTAAAAPTATSGIHEDVENWSSSTNSRASTIASTTSSTASASANTAAANSAKIRAPTPQSQPNPQSQSQSPTRPPSNPITSTSSSTTTSNVLGISKTRSNTHNTRRAMYHSYHHSHAHAHGHGHGHGHAHTHGHGHGHAHYDEGRGNTVRSDGKGVRKISGRVGSNGSAGSRDKGEGNQKEKEGLAVVGVVAGN